MVDKTITLDLTSEGIRQTAEVTQGDTGRVLNYKADRTGTCRNRNHRMPD